MHAGLTEGFNGGAGRAAGGTVLFDLTVVMSHQITKALASRETDRARLPRPLTFKKMNILHFCTVVVSMDCAMEQNLKKKVVHIESARRQIMHIVLLKRLVTIIVIQHNPPLK